MADKELKLKIGADAGQLSSELSGVINELKSFSANVTKSFNTLSKSLDNFRKSTEGVSSSLSNIPQSFDASAITQGVNTATSALEQIKETGNSVAKSLQNIPKSFQQIGSNTSSLDKINATIENTGNEALDTSRKFDVLSAIIANAIREIASSGAGINLVTAAINEMANAGLKAGDGFLAIGVKQPIQDITALRANVAQLKQDLATGFKPIVNIVDPKIPALLNSVSAALTNISPVVQGASAALQNAGASTQLFADKAFASSKVFQDFAAKVNTAISQVGTSSASINLVTAAINEMAAAGLRAGKGFVLAIGVQKPIQDIEILRANVAQLKQDLATGFKPIVTLVDPKIPPLLNSLSAAITNIAPAVNSSNAALQSAGNSSKVFAVSVNKSLNDVLRQFDSFRAEALGLGDVFQNIPVTLKPDTTAGIIELRQAVSLLKKEISGVDLIIPSLNIAPPNLDKIRNAFQQLGQLVSTAISQMGTSSAGVAQVTKALNEVGAAAINAGASFMAIGGFQNPIREVQVLKNNVADLKKELAAGITGKISIVDPDTPKLLNAISANLTNISPAVQQAVKQFRDLDQTKGILDRIQSSFAAALQSAGKSTAQFSDKALQSSNIFQDFASSVTTAISRIGASAGGVTEVTNAINQAAAAARNAGEGFLAIGVKAPIQDITTLRNNVQQLKDDLTRGFKPIVNIVDPNIPALLNSVSASLTNISPAVQNASTALRNASASTEVFADKALLSSRAFQDFSGKVTSAISQIGASASGITQVTAAINEAAAASRAAGDGFLSIGVQKPIQDITILRNNVEELRKDLERGFKPIVNLVDPNIGPLLNSVSAALTNISPAVNNANAALKLISASSQSFANSSLSSTRNFADFAVTVASASSSIASTGANILQITDAINQLGIATQNAGKGFLAIGVQAPIQDITVLRNNVEQLKAELATGFKPIVGIVDPSTGPLLNSVSAAIANITPAINQASTAFKQAGVAAQVFSNATNNAVNQSVQSLQNFRKVATTVLNIPPPNIPPINLTARLPLAPLQNFNKELLAIRNTINSGFKPALDKISFSAANFSSIKGAGNAIKQLTPEARAANFALTDMGRVLQDLPFGFTAIQNNITQLPQSFAALSAAAKASGQSIGKVLLTSLTGAGGIGIALSAITAAVTFASVGFGSWNRILGDTGKKAEEAADKARQFADELRSIGEIRIDAVGSVQGQIAEVQALSNAVRDETRSQEERGRAISALKQINKEHFADIGTTAAGLARLTKATNEYTQALIAEAVVKGFQDEISKIAPELAKQERILTTLADSYRKVAGAQQGFAKAAIPDARNFAGTIQAVSALKSLGDEQEKFTSQVNLVGDLRKQYAEVTKAIEGAVDAAIKLPSLQGSGTDTKNLKDQDAVLKSLKTTLEQYNKQLDIANEKRKLGILPTFEENDVFVLETQIEDLKRKIDAREVQLKLKTRLEIDPILDQSNFDRLENEFRKNLAIEDIVLPVDITPQVDKKSYFDKLHDAVDLREFINQITGLQIDIPLDINPLITSSVTDLSAVIPDDFNKSLIETFQKSAKQAAESFGKTLQEGLNEQLATIATQGIVDSLTLFAESVGGALSGVENPIAKFVQGFLGIIGDTLKELGKRIITASTLVETLKKTLQTAGLGAASIPIGIALVALGGFLKNITIPKFATGGIVTGPTVGLIGEAGPEVVFPLDRLQDFLNTNAGGVQDVRIYGELSNDLIVLSNKRGLASQGRRFGV